MFFKKKPNNKTLFLLRHGKAGFDSLDGTDKTRSLTSYGINQAENLAEQLKEKNIQIDLAKISSAKRTKGTWEAFSRKYPCEKTDFIFEDELYLASEETLLNQIQNTNNEIDNLLILAHNPGLTDLPNRIIKKVQLDYLPECGFLALGFSVNSWAEIGAKKGEFLWKIFYS